MDPYDPCLSKGEHRACFEFTKDTPKLSLTNDTIAFYEYLKGNLLCDNYLFDFMFYNGTQTLHLGLPYIHENSSITPNQIKSLD